MTQEHYYYGTGKRKTAIAKVRLYTRPGNVVVNGKPLEEAFPWDSWQDIVTQPLQVTETLGKYSVQAQVYGGGITGQAAAVRHGTGKRAAHMPEQLALDQLLGYRRTIDFDERAGAPPAQLVDVSGDQLLAGAILAVDEHPAVGWSRHGHLLP